jgi:hypothetical protein
MIIINVLLSIDIYTLPRPTGFDILTRVIAACTHARTHKKLSHNTHTTLSLHRGRFQDTHTHTHTHITQVLSPLSLSLSPRTHRYPCNMRQITAADVDRQTDRQTDIQSDSQADTNTRNTNSLSHTNTHTHTHTHTHSLTHFLSVDTPISSPLSSPRRVSRDVDMPSLMSPLPVPVIPFGRTGSTSHVFLPRWVLVMSMNVYMHVACVYMACKMTRR